MNIDYLKYVIEAIEKDARREIQTAKNISDGADAKWVAQMYMEVYANERILGTLTRIRNAMEEDDEHDQGND